MPRTRYQDAPRGLQVRQLPAAALRAALRDGYGVRDLRADVLATLQLKDVLGVELGAGTPSDVLGRLRGMWTARGTVSLAELAVAALTLSLLILLPRLTRRVPAPLVALPVAAAVAALLSHL